ncbi:MAG: hypothetical protein ACREE9_19430, partial [Stellaceae bacterium]
MVGRAIPPPGSGRSGFLAVGRSFDCRRDRRPGELVAFEHAIDRHPRDPEFGSGTHDHLMMTR